MNTLQILDALQYIPEHTIGVYPADKLPKVWTRPTAFVVNTDGHTRPGEHWVAMYVDRSGRGWYFDSYGLPPLIPQHIAGLRRNCKIFRSCDKRLQQKDSEVCGQYCIMFLHCMSIFTSPQRFLMLFSQKLKSNDDIAQDYYKTFIHKNKKKKCNDNIMMGNGLSKKYMQKCTFAR